MASQPPAARADRTRADERGVVEELPPPHVHRESPAAASDHGHPLPHDGMNCRDADALLSNALYFE